jgi:hypothetical protein
MKTRDRAVEALCDVISFASRPIWVVDSRSGIKPEYLTNPQSGDVIVTHGVDNVRTEGGVITKENLNRAVASVAGFVASGNIRIKWGGEIDGD